MKPDRKPSLAQRALAAREGQRDIPAIGVEREDEPPSPLEGSSPSDTSLSARVARAHTDRKCLLLDVSGSMSEEVERGLSKWESLSEMLQQFEGVRQFSFADRCREVTGPLPFPAGGTNMAGAFRTMKSEGIERVVLITDGLPQDEEGALLAARGLRIDIVYVGPPPPPPFLARLAGVGGGVAYAGSLKRTGVPAIQSRVRAILALPPGKEEKKT